MMIRRFITATIVFGFTATLLALPSEDAGARYYYSYSAPPPAPGRPPEAAGVQRKPRTGPTASRKPSRFKRMGRIFGRRGGP